jgi:hypothetical protein
MALPSREKTFAFENCRDVLEKLHREVDQYAAAYNADDIEAMRDLAFNASVTAWQLCDWVFGDMTPAQRDSLKIQKLQDLQEYARANCRALYLCRQSATASKHWEISRYPDPDVAVVVTCLPYPNLPSPQQVAFPPGVTLRAVPHWQIYFADGSIKLEAYDVFEEALGFWTSYIYQNKISA